MTAWIVPSTLVTLHWISGREQGGNLLYRPKLYFVSDCKCVNHIAKVRYVKICGDLEPASSGHFRKHRFYIALKHCLDAVQ